jgi:hypothetical protein
MLHFHMVAHAGGSQEHENGRLRGPEARAKQVNACVTGETIRGKCIERLSC